MKRFLLAALLVLVTMSGCYTKIAFPTLEPAEQREYETRRIQSARYYYYDDCIGCDPWNYYYYHPYWHGGYYSPWYHDGYYYDDDDGSYVAPEKRRSTPSKRRIENPTPSGGTYRAPSSESTDSDDNNDSSDNQDDNKRLPSRRLK